MSIRPPLYEPRFFLVFSCLKSLPLTYIIATLHKHLRMQAGQIYSGAQNLPKANQHETCCAFRSMPSCQQTANRAFELCAAEHAGALPTRNMVVVCNVYCDKGQRTGSASKAHRVPVQCMTNLQERLRCFSTPTRAAKLGFIRVVPSTLLAKPFIVIDPFERSCPGGALRNSPARLRPLHLRIKTRACLLVSRCSLD